MRSLGNSVAAVGLAFWFVLPVVAQKDEWQVVFLHPPGFTASDALAAAGPLQGGRVTVADGTYRPVLWSGSAQTYVSLLPDGFSRGLVHGMDGPWQVGNASSSTTTHAVLWSGSAESAVVLSPGGAYVVSYARGVSGNQQVGYAGHGGDGQYHAALWHGSAASFVDLHPSLALWSEAWATDGVNQGGRADIDLPGVGIHAALWQGNAASFIDMNPPGATTSKIVAMAQGVQVGDAQFGTALHAVLWRGAPDDYVSLNPPGSSNASLFNTTGKIHVGSAYVNGTFVAGVWLSNEPNSFVNLQPYLGSGWIRSSAKAVAVDGDWLYVAGGALPTNGPERAVLWMRRLPRPGSPAQNAATASPPQEIFAP